MLGTAVRYRKTLALEI